MVVAVVIMRVMEVIVVAEIAVAVQHSCMSASAGIPMAVTGVDLDSTVAPPVFAPLVRCRHASRLPGVMARQ